LLEASPNPSNRGERYAQCPLNKETEYIQFLEKARAAQRWPPLLEEVGRRLQSGNYFEVEPPMIRNTALHQLLIY
jgi:hypothetical protein